MCHFHQTAECAILYWILVVLLSVCLYTNTHTRLMALCSGLPGWAGTRKVKPIWILLKQETVSGSGISWAICKHLAPDRQPRQHPTTQFLQAGCPSCHPTNSVKALKAQCINTHTFNSPFPGLPGWACTRKVKPVWISLKQETVSGSGISWAVCKSAPRSRQITTPAPHHSVFYRPDALPAAQPTASRQSV